MCATNSGFCSLLISLSAPLLCSIFVLGEAAFAQTKIDLSTRMQRLHKHLRSLEQEPNLPLLPKHPLRKLQGGLSIKQAHGPGSSYSLRYIVNDKVNNVIDWYQNALSGLGWTVKPKSVSEYQKNLKYLMATREGSTSTCIIGVFPASYNDRRCNVSVRYTDFPAIAQSNDRSRKFSKEPDQSKRPHNH